jgi:hypothetical protein
MIALGHQPADGSRGERVMFRALICGVAILVAASVLWFVGLKLETFQPALALFIWAAPFASAAIVSYLAPKRKLLLGLSMTIPSVLSPLAFHALYQLRGNPVDFPGLDGAMSLAAIITPFTLLLCGGGALIGWMVSRRAHKTSQPGT